MSCSCNHISNTNFTVSVNNSVNQIIIDSQDPCTPQVNISCNACETVEIIHYGPNGGPGSQGPSGSCNCNTSSFITNSQTSSMSVLSASYAFNSYVSEVSVLADSAETAATASYVELAVSSSYSLTSSYALNSGATVGGPNGSVQYNSSGSLEGSAKLIWNGNTLNVSGSNYNIISEDTIGAGSYLGGDDILSGSGLFDYGSGMPIAMFSPTSLNNENNIFTYGGGLRYFLDGGILSVTSSLIMSETSINTSRFLQFDNIKTGIIKLNDSLGDVTNYFQSSRVYIKSDDFVYNGLYNFSSSTYDGSNTRIQLEDISVETQTGFVTNPDIKIDSSVGGERIGDNNYTEGLNNKNLGFISNVGGTNNVVLGTGSIVRGENCEDLGNNNLLFGYDCESYGSFTVNHGLHCITRGAYSHAEGAGSEADQFGSHAEGVSTKATGTGAHSEGYITSASGNYSHAGGIGTIADNEGQTVVGKYNNIGTSSLFVVGNGVDNDNRSDIFYVDENNNGLVGGLVLKSINIFSNDITNYNVSNKDYVINVDTNNDVVAIDFRDITLVHGKTYIIKDVGGNSENNKIVLDNITIENSYTNINKNWECITIIYNQRINIWSIINRYTIG